MGRYIDWADVVGRYPEQATGRSATEVGSAFIYFAEMALDSDLGPYFTSPFSSNNVTVKDLAIDLTLANILRFKDIEKSKEITDYVKGRIADLIGGKSSMVTTSGDLLGSTSEAILGWSLTQDYHPVFGLSPPSLLEISSAQINDERGQRGEYGY